MIILAQHVGRALARNLYRGVSLTVVQPCDPWLTFDLVSIHDMFMVKQMLILRASLLRPCQARYVNVEYLIEDR
jgi:hypothetical protein